MKTTRVLTTSGGGTLGLYELAVLAEIENQYCLPHGKLLRDYFDIIVGCSRGALTAAAIASGVPLATMINPLRAVAAHIFPEDSNVITKTVRLVKSASGDAYDFKRMRDVCKYFLGENLLKNLPQTIELHLLTYWLEGNQPKAFISKKMEDENVSLVDAVMASSSIPTGFPPYKIGENRYCDGFPFADDPTLYAQSKIGAVTGDASSYKILTVSNFTFQPKDGGCGRMLLSGDHINAVIHMTAQCAFMRSTNLSSLLATRVREGGAEGDVVSIPCYKFPTSTTVTYNNSDPKYLEELLIYAKQNYKDSEKDESVRLGARLFQTSDT